jgi:hypothetical protein
MLPHAAMTQQPRPIDVQFTLLADDGAPIAGAPVRLAVGASADRQHRDAGMRFVTDAAGAHRFTPTATIDTRERKLPTNFFTQLLSRAQRTDHLTIWMELPYLGRPWLYVVDVDRFPDGTVAQLDGMHVFGADASGAFAVPARFANGVWTLPGVPGVVTTAGHAVTSLMLEPNADRSRWSLVILVRRHREPVVR